jgi:predicted component of type VI protein secretion system
MEQYDDNVGNEIIAERHAREQAWVAHTIHDVNDIIEEFGVEVVFEHLSDYARQEIVRHLTETF